MAGQLVSSSSFTSNPSWKYDVFLSFRGEDTRTSFTDHLYKGLVDKGIHTFIDRQLSRGEEISPALLKAIEESRISLVIFSKSYASSRWCLDELVKILQCRESKKQIVLPVFYKVDPSNVRKQTGSFGGAFTDHESNFKDDMEKVLMWRRALTEVANLSGHHFRKGESMVTLISNIVENILLKVLDGTYLKVAKHPVGIDSCVQEVKELLGVGGNDCCVVGIWGTPGIGKTTIAKAVYKAIAHEFEGSCFLADVRERSTSHGGVIQLQKDLLSKVLRVTEIKIDDVYQGISFIEKLLRGKKVLLILDDVHELEQLNNLVEVHQLGEGSRVIITTKNKGLLESCKVELIYKVQKLEDNKALELFSWNAFGEEKPPDDYLGLAQRAIAYAQGLPLALNLIGSLLRGKNIDRWQDMLDSYDEEPYRGIQRVLRKSYDTLDYVPQQVFLDIACFFKGEDKDKVLQILKGSNLKVRQHCIDVLVENAIITIEDNRILMESLKSLDISKSGIRELPSSIAYLTGLGMLFASMCKNLTGTSLHHIYGLQHLYLIDMERCPKLVTFGKFSTCLDTSHYNGIPLVLPRVGELYLDGCNLSESDFLVPFHCWSTLAHLDLSRNNFVSLPDCISKFVNLVILCLTGCKRLQEIPHALPPNLSNLNLDDCTSLEKIPKLPSGLRSLKLTNCVRLSGDEVAKLENNLLNLNQESPRCSQLKVTYPGDEVPKQFSYTSKHLTATRIECDEWRDYVGGSEFSFEIPLNLQERETLLGLALSCVYPPLPFREWEYHYIFRIHISEASEYDKFPVSVARLETAHVRLMFVDLEKKKKQGDICKVKFQFPVWARVKMCGVHPLFRKEDGRLPLSLGAMSSLGSQQQQWPSLSSNPADDHPKRTQIDHNVPSDIEEEQEQPSTISWVSWLR